MYVDTMLMMGGRIPQGAARIRTRNNPSDDWDEEKSMLSGTPVFDLILVLTEKVRVLPSGKTPRATSWYHDHTNAAFLAFMLYNKKDFPKELMIASYSSINYTCADITEDKKAAKHCIEDYGDHLAACFSLTSRQVWSDITSKVCAELDDIYADSIPRIDRWAEEAGVLHPSPAVLTCPECPHWGLMTGRCSKTGLERGSNDVCTIPKGGTNVR